FADSNPRPKVRPRPRRTDGYTFAPKPLLWQALSLPAGPLTPHPLAQYSEGDTFWKEFHHVNMDRLALTSHGARSRRAICRLHGQSAKNRRLRLDGFCQARKRNG